MGKCEYCGKTMMKTKGCSHPLVLIDDTWYSREPNFGSKCADCGCESGYLHHFGCDNENDPRHLESQMIGVSVKALMDKKKHDIQVFENLNQHDILIILQQYYENLTIELENEKITIYINYRDIGCVQIDYMLMCNLSYIELFYNAKIDNKMIYHNMLSYQRNDKKLNVPLFIINRIEEAEPINKQIYSTIENNPNNNNPELMKEFVSTLFKHS
jgi:hypothetical protein